MSKTLGRTASAVASPLLGRAQPPLALVPANAGEPEVAPAPQARPREPLLFLDGAASLDLLETTRALQPLAQLAALADTPTPLMIGVVGAAGTGKSFALARLSGAIDALAGAAGRTESSPFLSRVARIALDAAALSGDSEVAIACAARQALAKADPAFAAEAAQASADPQASAREAADRHYEIAKALEQERAARDDAEGRAARLPETLIYETPGSRLDSFIRSRRGAIAARLRRFGLASGDAGMNYRDLVAGFAGAGAGSGVRVAARAVFAYRSQVRLLAGAALFASLGLGIGALRSDATAAWLGGLGEVGGRAGQALQAHVGALDNAVAALFWLAAALVFANLWRAGRFSSLLSRGALLLDADIRDRKRGLEAMIARLNGRVAALWAESEAAGRHADAMAKRAGASATPTHAPSPAFARGAASAASQGARAYMAEISAMLSSGRGATGPQRLIFTLDNLDALQPEAARRLVETLRGLCGPGCVAIVACDPAATFPELDASMTRERCEKWFQASFAMASQAADGGALVAQLLGAPAPQDAAPEIDVRTAPLSEPFGEEEGKLLSALAPLAGQTPRDVKRFLNIYRLARLGPAPRPVTALMLALVQGGDARMFKALKRAISEAVDAIDNPDAPAPLVAAMNAARAANRGPLLLRDVGAALTFLQRFTLAPPFPT